MFSSLTSNQGAKDAGKVAAQLKRSSPFSIDEAPTQKLMENPLSFSPIQYPLDLSNNELGHYIIFESGFIGYEPQTSGLISHAGRQEREKITSKTGNRSITTAAIALYMPTSIKATYSQTYDGESAGIAGDVEAALHAGKLAGDMGGGPHGAKTSAAQVKAVLAGMSGIAIRQGKKLVGELATLAGAGDPIRFMQKRSGTALNPRNEQFYDSPDFRNFSYTFDFWPRNEKEAKAVSDIITIFKYNSSPGLKDTAGAIFEIPNYFRISYMFRGEENSNLNKISACYCKSVDVDYAPESQPSFFDDGQPVHTKLTLEFVEDRILTKNDIMAGA
jgi:hypothetical protein